MNGMKELNINRFRHLHNLMHIRIGEKLTVIAGGNGTGKSSLLGLMGHVFSYREGGKVIMNPFDKKPLETQFSEVFRFSPYHDYEPEYSYSLVFNDGTSRNGVSRFVVKNNRFRIDIGTREKGHGKVRCPVIYLSLKRLIPLAQESEDSIKALASELGDEEARLYKEWHNSILVLDDNVAPRHIKSRNKELYYPVCDKYDELGSSAGQDNLAQIILALLSFRRMKEELEDNYPGGILLIDEIETTLYPAAQHQLMHRLLRAAGDYDLQIVFTTHSTDTIRYMLNPREQTFYRSTEIVYLYKPKGAIEVCQEKSQLPEIVADLEHSVREKTGKDRVNVYLEDEEARLFFKGIVKSELRSELAISKCNSGAEFYGTLLENKFPEFRRSLIVLDGDKSTSSRLKRNGNVLFLPGSQRPENMVHDYLVGLPDDDEFWETKLGGYNKQVFLRGKPGNTSDGRTMKQWFGNEKTNWGNGCRRLMLRWGKDNERAVSEFNERVKSRIERLKTV